MIDYIINQKHFKFSITFSKLKKLRYFDENLYQDFFDYYSVKEKSLSEKAVLIYIAYLCENIDDINALAEDKFYSMLEDDISVIESLFSKIYYSKINYDFAKAFKRKTKNYDKKIRIPEFELSDLEDYYCYFVLLNNIPENTFWNCEIPFVEAVAINKNAVDGFMNYQQYRILNKK